MRYVCSIATGSNGRLTKESFNLFQVMEASFTVINLLISKSNKQTSTDLLRQ